MDDGQWIIFNFQLSILHFQLNVPVNNLEAFHLDERRLELTLHIADPERVGRAGDHPLDVAAEHRGVLVLACERANEVLRALCPVVAYLQVVAADGEVAAVVCENAFHFVGFSG